MSRLLLLLLTTLFLAHLTLAEFELDDLDDDSYTRQQGSAENCPSKIRFRTEDAVIRSERIRINEADDCAEGTSINLAAVNGSPGVAASPAVRFFASRSSDVETFFQGRNAADIDCGSITFPRGTQWIFLNPDDELDDVKWADVFGEKPPLAEEGDDEVDFDDNERYLIIGDICFYEDSSFISDNVCFPADASVQLENGESKRMDALAIGDRVHVGNGVYSDVFAWTHNDAVRKFKFVELTTAQGGKLTATPGHYIYADGQSMQMKDVRPGMSLLQADGSADTVVRKKRVLKNGLFNPQTVHGDIVVDGFVASTYTTAVQPEAAHALLAPVRAAFQAVKAMLPVAETSA